MDLRLRCVLNRICIPGRFWEFCSASQKHWEMTCEIHKCDSRIGHIQELRLQIRTHLDASQSALPSHLPRCSIGAERLIFEWFEWCPSSASLPFCRVHSSSRQLFKVEAQNWRAKARELTAQRIQSVPCRLFFWAKISGLATRMSFLQLWSLWGAVRSVGEQPAN